MYYLKFLFLIIFFPSCGFSVFEENELPGFRFSNFENTICKELAIAVQNQDLMNIEEIIIKNKIDVNFAEPKFNFTLLHCAIANNKISSVQKLLQLGANVNYKSYSMDSLSPLMTCCRYSNTDTNLIAILLNYGADINEITTTYIYNNNNKNQIVPLQQNPLHSLITAGYFKKTFEAFKYLISKGANINVGLNGEINSLIFKSIILDRIDMTYYLVKQPDFIVPKYFGEIYKNTNTPLKLTITEALKKFKHSEKTEVLSNEVINYLSSISKE